MVNLSDTLIQYKVTSTTCSILAASMTLYRLYIRRGRWRSDDAWAIIALLILGAQVGAVFMHVDNPGNQSKLTRIAAYYLLAISFYGVTWASRISIIYSIIRIDPSTQRKKVYIWASYLYLLTCIVLVLQLFWVCEPHPSWKDERSPQCHLDRQVAILQLITDIIADLFLLIAPLRLVARLRDKAMRTKLILIFSTCLVTTIVSIVHATLIIIGSGKKEIIAALVEDCMSLVVCNVPVVVTAMMRFCEDALQRKPDGGIMVSMIRFASDHMGIPTASMSSNIMTMTATTTNPTTNPDGPVSSTMGISLDLPCDPISLGLEDGTTLKGNEKQDEGVACSDDSYSGL